MKPVKILIVGAGDRGTLYARLAKKNWPPAEVVGVAEPREQLRENLAAEHALPPERVFEDWAQAGDLERFADAVIIATPDGLHTEPSLTFMRKGYHVLLEKPMATTADLCKTITETALESGTILAVGHVLRYTDYTQRLRVLIESGVIGDLMAIQRLEPIGFDHFAHSYVRGNWRREEESSFSLLTKASHDLDWIRYLVRSPCREISSFAELKFFTTDSRPIGASDRCLECRIERTCPYSAKKIYLDPAVIGERGWPLNVITTDPKPRRVIEALKEGPYGRCVFACDNDVADTQVVNMVFKNGCIASFMMTAFTPIAGRKTTLFGSRGQIIGDGRHIEHLDFLTGKTKKYDTHTEEAVDLGGHGGGDGRLLSAFIQAVGEKVPDYVLSGPKDSLESHLMVFAAERARRQSEVVSMKEFLGENNSPRTKRTRRS